MCGFSGFITTKNITRDKIISNMLEKIHHRGPDENGVFFDDSIGLCFGHKRLAIQDLSSLGQQPMLSNNQRYVLVFNGEIYNFKTLKKQLNYSFKGNSDTEVLLAGFQEWGLEKTLNNIVGMFAFALWDKQQKTLILARDRMGEKPLYYGFQKESFLFGSDLASLKQHPDFINEIDRNALASFMRYSYVPTPQSIYKGIKKLPAGHYYQYKNGQEKIIKYWSIEDSYQKAQQSPIIDDKEAKELLKKLLQQSVNEQMIADVPTGAFLSGGIDSSLITALMQQQSEKKIDTFTIGFDSPKYNESEFAKKIATHLNTNHHELILNATDCLNIVPKLSKIYSEPFADASQIPTFLVAKMAKKHITVALSGDGADELFCGYNRYYFVPKVWDKIKNLSAKQRNILKIIINKIPARFLSKFLDQSNLTDKLFKLANVINSNSYNHLYQNVISQYQDNIVKNSDYINFNEVNSIEEMMLSDQQHYLADDILTKVDRASMAVSLETRAPFLDYRIVEFSHKIPLAIHSKNNQSKYLLREILYDFVPKNLIDRPKMGFSVPIEYWLRNELKDWADSLLQKNKLNEYFDADIILKKFSEHLSGKRNWQYQLWNVLMFMSWLDD
ncbi:Asparagine synthetase [glutamine-hydrolyzing] [hydrothermal vent metagenome]|uniref:Asparagine synthetase [glutamine-hydrolyzing] n=1 Tax=hydrothermal vent metagenome TaxID=652676 RepID=A0A1W1C313_9ZZZZ